MRVTIPRSIAALAAGSAIFSGARLHAPATPIRATVSSLEYLGTTYSAGAKVPIFRSTAAEIIVRGQFVDLSTGVEVRTTGGAAANDLGATITERVGGTPARIKVRLTSNQNSVLRAYRILIHYVVETNGPDQFEVTLFERGTVNSLSIVNPSQQLANGGYLAGKQLDIRADGTGMSRAAIATNATALSGITVVPSTILGTPTDATRHFSIKFEGSGFKQFAAGKSFYDGNLGPPPDEGACIGAICYGGSESLVLLIRILPAVASASPTSTAPGNTVTLSGTRLQPQGYTPKVRFLRKYRSNANSADIVVATTASGGTLQFVTPHEVRPDSIRLSYEDPASTRDSLAATAVLVPAITVAAADPPLIQRLDSLGPIGNRKAFIKAGNQVLRGRNLAVPSLNGVVFQAQLGIVSAGYRASSANVSGQTGADSIVFTVPFPHASFADTVERNLTVQTQFGTSTASNVLFVPPPSVTEIRTFAAVTGGIEATIPLSGGTLVRGKKYRLRGKGLLLSASSGTFREVAGVRLNGVTRPVTQSTSGFTTAETDAVFEVPTTATDGMLEIITSGGTTTVGPFTFVNGSTAVDLVGLSLSPTSVPGGQPVTATVAINGTIPANGSAGNVVFAVDGGDTSFVVPTGFIPVISNPLVVTIPTRAVNTQRSAIIRVSSDPNASPQDVVSASLTLRPPAPTSIALNPTSVTGGRSVRGVVRLNTAVPAGAGISLSLTSSDPTTFTVPATVPVTGDSAVFTVTSAVVPVDRQVTVTATAGGESRSASVAVLSAALREVIVSPDTIVPGVYNAKASFSLTGPLATPGTATVACDARLFCPATVDIPTGSVKPEFTVQGREVPAKVQVPVDLTFNGVTKGTLVTLKPLTIRALTMSPDTVRAGVQSSLTIQLNAVVPNGRTATVSFESSDPSVVPRPGQVVFEGGEITKLKTITTVGPLSSARVITLTVTFTQNLATGGVNTSSEQVRITVIP